jgi:MATE family multidrug resistance protein
MVPLGIGSAGAVLVGQALGRLQPAQAIRTGWLSLVLALFFNLASATAFAVFARPLLAVYTTDSAVTEVALSLMVYAALFQLSDSAQAVATGILRGVGDTRSAAVANAVGHWLLGLPIGVYLCFVLQQGARGLWIGLSLGLTTVAIALVVQWVRRSKVLVTAQALGV